MLRSYPCVRLVRINCVNNLRRRLVTLAIETSCDDTCVAVVEKTDCSEVQNAPPLEERDDIQQPKAKIHYHERITSESRQYQGIHPTVATSSHQKNLGHLIAKASRIFQQSGDNHGSNPATFALNRPDFISVTRGPGMRASLQTGLDMAKGLAAAWQIPLIGVHHMQAHLLTPRFASALDQSSRDAQHPPFPFLSLLVSGGHTMLVESRSLNDHSILASTMDIAIGDALDKIARFLLPNGILESSETVSYGPVLEKFAFPNGGWDYPFLLTDDLLPSALTKGKSFRFDRGLQGSRKRDMVFSFNGMFSTAERIRQKNDQDHILTETQMRLLAREAMRVAFEQLASRIVLALEARAGTADESSPKLEKVVISGGVAANKFLGYVIREYLSDHGFSQIELMSPPLEYCTDNAVMIAWAGLEMHEAGWTTDFGALAIDKWSLDSTIPGGGICGVQNWHQKVQTDHSTF